MRRADSVAMIAPIFLLALIAKGERADLTQDEKSDLAADHRRCLSASRQD